MCLLMVLLSLSLSGLACFNRSLFLSRWDFKTSGCHGLGFGVIDSLSFLWCLLSFLAQHFSPLEDLPAPSSHNVVPYPNKPIERVLQTVGPCCPVHCTVLPTPACELSHKTPSSSCAQAASLVGLETNPPGIAFGDPICHT